MTMIVNRALCKGCGDCVEVCPNKAILLKEGKAFIDQAKCSSCQVCADVCPTGALQLERRVTPAIVEKPGVIEILRSQTALESSPKQSSWGGTVLSLVAQHFLLRMADVLATFLERRISTPVQERTMMTVNPVENRPYQRRRQRRGRYSKI